MEFIKLSKKTASHFINKGSPQIAAALSYYSLFAIAPILIILFTVISMFLSNLQTQQIILGEINKVFSQDTANIVRNVIANIAHYSPPNTLTGTLGVLLLLVSSTTVVRELQRALNALWENQADKNSISQRFKKRIMAFLFIIVLGLLVFLSFIINTILSSIGDIIASYIGFDPTSLYTINIIISLLTVTILFMLLFRYLPDKTVTWKHNIIGSLVTGILFIIGKNIISYILSHSDYGSLYGTAGTVLVFLFWVYYTSLIFLFGATFTYIFAKANGDPVSK